MINSVEEYEYVTGADVDEAHPHGDLDRIVIDGLELFANHGVYPPSRARTSFAARTSRS